jgi:capsular polysaccharide biosynthesis protein
MELRALWSVIVRRWPLVVVPLAVALLLALAASTIAGSLPGRIQSLLYAAFPQPTFSGYSTTMRYAVGQSPDETGEILADDPRYKAWLTSEYIANALADWTRTGSFASAVSEELRANGGGVDAAQLQGHFAADNQRSVMVLYVQNWPDAQQLEQIAQAATRVLQTRNREVFPQLGDGAQVTPLDPVVVSAAPPGLSSRLTLPLRLGLALAAGLALAFLVDYLDPTIRGRAELEGMGLSVLGEIPKRKRAVSGRD